jgi:hypothetical protein
MIVEINTHKIDSVKSNEKTNLVRLNLLEILSKISIFLFLLNKFQLYKTLKNNYRWIIIIS